MIVRARHPRRLVLACGIVALLLGVVAARLGQLALVDGDRLASLARRQRVTNEEFKPLRGAIVDRGGDPLAISIGAESVFVRPAELPQNAAQKSVAAAFGLPPDRWLQKISAKAPFVWVKRQASPDEVAQVRALDFPGVGTVPERRRFYPHGRMASTVVGVAGIDSQGLEGIELAYDRYLRGSTSEVGFERDARGRKFAVRGMDDGTPQTGANVVLTLDSSLQYVAERELGMRVKETRARGGLVLMLAPHTGEILALAQNPSFDPNRQTSVPPGLRRNRAVTDVYEPGSTLKALLAAAALEHHAVAPSERFFCENGSYAIGGRVVHDHKGYGWLTLPEVLQVSSNIGATKIGQRLGAKRYAQTLRDFGLGVSTGVDLAGEQAGVVRPVASWRTIDLATASFGQGVAVTPLQLSAAFAALANGGLLMRPYLVKRVLGENGDMLLENRPTVVRRVVSEATANEVTKMLERVLTPKGTGNLASIPGVRVAGKTGTAQKVDLVRGGYARGLIASFVGYFPLENPRIVMLVIIDEPQTTVWGGTAAAPVFRAIGMAIAERLGVEPARLQAVETPGASEAAETEGAAFAGVDSDGRGPRFLGMSLREAIESARRVGLSLEIVGSGYVVKQDPPPGASFAPGSSVRLELAIGGGPLG